MARVEETLEVEIPHLNQDYGSNQSVMIDPKPAVFSPERFLMDIRKTSHDINAPYSEATIQAVLTAYRQNFVDGAAFWRTTNRPGDALNFRFYERHPVDCIAIAVAAGFLTAENPLGRMITSLSSLYDGTLEQFCDFDAQTGLSKTWVFLGGKRPVEEILQAPDVPEPVRCLGPAFQELGLTIVCHVAVDYHSNSVDIYFHLPGPISKEQAIKLVGLACPAPPPLPVVIQRMCMLLHSTDFSFAPTIDVTTGAVTRVAFYGHRWPPGGYIKFVECTPSHDEEELNVVAWSFGADGKNYLAERSYFGQLTPLLRGWNRA